jgi:hypothetical protein
MTEQEWMECTDPKRMLRWIMDGNHQAKIGLFLGFLDDTEAKSGQLDKSDLAFCSPILRDIVGNPFRPVNLDPSWLTSTVVDLANAIYEEDAFDRLPVLAGALQEAGCNSEEMIAHCRSEGPHVRGCWLIDLLLGKE